jgi:thiol-disulfide isomerase/thioredoxin
MKTKIAASLIVGSLLATAKVLLAAPADQPASDGRRAEYALLNHRVDLGGLVSQPAPGAAWQRLKVTKAPILVLNLWSRSCKPCLEELPIFRRLTEQFPDVPFVFAADPPEDTSREDISRFWARPIIDLAASRCVPPTGEKPALGGPLACRLFLPATAPARSEDGRLSRSLDSPGLRPITLLLDDNRVVRQAFVGALNGRDEDLARSIERLRSVQTVRTDLRAQHP